MKNLKYDFRDLFKAWRIGFSFQRIWVNSIGLFAGYLIYLIVSYISLLVGGQSFDQAWNQFGLLPCGIAVSIPWYARLIYFIGLLAFGAIILLTNTAVARVSYMALREELFYSWKQAYKFAFKKWVSAIGAVLTFIFIIAFFVIGALVMGLLGRIPYIGELGTALLTLPYLFAAMVLLFVFIVSIVGIFLIPVILATADEDALGSVFQSFSITFTQPWRLAVYTIIVGFLEIVGLFLFAVGLKLSYEIFIKLFSFGMGEKIIAIKSHALHLVDQALPALYNWLHALPCDLGQYIYLSQPTSAAALPGVQVVAAFIMAIFFLLYGASAVAYGEAVGNAGLTILYVVLYKKQENENLLEREDEELKEEEEEETSAETEKSTEGGTTETEENKTDEGEKEKSEGEKE